MTVHPKSVHVKIRACRPAPTTPHTVGRFPDVLIHASESAVKQHPAYWAAKTGDDDAAAALVVRHVQPRPKLWRWMRCKLQAGHLR
jgi:hypothetical protein